MVRNSLHYVSWKGYQAVTAFGERWDSQYQQIAQHVIGTKPFLLQCTHHHSGLHAHFWCITPSSSVVLSSSGATCPTIPVIKQAHYLHIR